MQWRGLASHCERGSHSADGQLLGFHGLGRLLCISRREKIVAIPFVNASMQDFEALQTRKSKP